MKALTLTIPDAQRALGLGRTTLYALLAKGELQRVRIGRRTLVTVESLEALIAQAITQGDH